MGSPTGRLLELLELLQAEPLVTGAELAARLGVDRRTVRREVATLQRLGIPVEGERGVGGGYRLRPGYRLPPLMLSEDEAAVVVLGLAAARRLALGDGAATDGALAKIQRVLPDSLRRRVEALEAALVFTGRAATIAAPAGETSLLLAEAIRRRRRVRIAYHTFAGEKSERDVSPFGLVVHDGRWYLPAHDHTRDALRTFRVDRIDRAVLGTDAVAAPQDFNAATHVTASLAQVPWPHAIEARLDLPFATARERVPPTLAQLTADGDWTLLHMRVSSLDWAASFLAGLDCSFEVVEPAKLRTAVRALADRLRASARA
jgi:predicted DNA-binding transcriptional regulator YafY